MFTDHCHVAGETIFSSSIFHVLVDDNNCHTHLDGLPGSDVGDIGASGFFCPGVFELGLGPSLSSKSTVVNPSSGLFGQGTTAKGFMAIASTAEGPFSLCLLSGASLKLTDCLFLQHRGMMTFSRMSVYKRRIAILKAKANAKTPYFPKAVLSLLCLPL